MYKLKNIVKIIGGTFLLLVSINIFAQQYWGAVYINKETGITGAAWDWETEEEAISEAKKHCIRKNEGKSGACKIVAGGGFSNGCFAVYWSSITKNYGWGYSGYGERDATIDALETCRENGGKSCKEVLSFCTSRYY